MHKPLLYCRCYAFPNVLIYGCVWMGREDGRGRLAEDESGGEKDKDREKVH